MRKLIVPIALLLMAVLLGFAVVRDCVRLAADRNSRVLVADGEMVTQEIRLVNILSSSPKTTPEVYAAISTSEVNPRPPGSHAGLRRARRKFQQNDVRKD